MEVTMVFPVISRNFTIMVLFASLLFFFHALCNAFALSGPDVRKPAWAGRFYPADPDRLKTMIAGFLEQDQGLSGQSKDLPPVSHDRKLRAVVFPHAGYEYSGIVAARSALEIEGRNFSTVIIMGPDHRVGFSNVALSSASAWKTPLGDMPVSPRAELLRRHSRLFRPVELSDRTEHSIEVVLPFLQYVLKDFSIIPLVAGPCRVSEISSCLDPLLDDRTLMVVSSDLSHYLPGEQARIRDHETIDSILKLDSSLLENDENRACGKYPLMILLDIARRHHWKPVLLMYRNSGDITGDDSRVVGYASLAFYQDKKKGAAERVRNDKHAEKSSGGMKVMDTQEKPQFLTQEQGIALTLLARQAIEAAFEQTDTEPPLPPELDAPELREERGTFVTLTKHGMLRGCIGNIMPRGSIVESVKRNALYAAFRDFRFPPLTRDELDEIHIEVSILTLPEKLEYSGAEDLLAKLRPGVHGVIIEKDGASATFLPQVWEQLPDPAEFLSRLCMKAGLSANEWKNGTLKVQTYEVQYFDEPEPRSGK